MGTDEKEEEYQTWKKNCPYMYRMVSETVLPRTSYTFQWLPDAFENDHVVTQRMLLANSSSDDKQNELLVASVQFPDEKYDYDDPPDMNTSVIIEKEYLHQAEINRARYMPQRSSLVATIDAAGDVNLFDINEPAAKDEFKPKATLKHHTRNGYGLTWNGLNEGILATCSDDTTVALWDVNSASGEVKPFRVYKEHQHEYTVNDVDFSRHDKHLLASVSDDWRINFYDDRQDGKVNSVYGQSDEINTLEFSPFSKNMLATAGKDCFVTLWDMRNMSRMLHSLSGQAESVYTVHWSPHVDGVLGSGSEDSRMILWDIHKIGEEQTPEDAEDGSPEILFMHGGHKGMVFDFGFNPLYKWFLGSVSDYDDVQIWCPLEKIVDPPRTNVPNNELE